MLLFRIRPLWFFCVPALVLFHASLGAQTLSETEPNNECTAAQPVSLSDPLRITGDIASGDVDYFAVSSLVAGATYEVRLMGASSESGLSDPFLGYFNDQTCQLVGSNDDAEAGRDSLLLIQAPESGVAVLAAAGYPNGSFLADQPSSTGAYALSITRVVFTTFSARGRAVDSVTGEALPGLVASLERCITENCGLTVFVSDRRGNSNGSFFFRQINGRTGRYILLVTDPSGQYPSARSAILSVEEGTSELDFSRIPVPSPSVRFDNFHTTCTDVNPGELCEITADLINRSDRRSLNLRHWIVINFTDSNSRGVPFQLGASERNPSPQRLRLDPGQTSSVRYELRLPRSLVAGQAHFSQIVSSQFNDPLQDVSSRSFLFTPTIEPFDSSTPSFVGKFENGSAKVKVDAMSAP